VIPTETVQASLRMPTQWSVLANVLARLSPTHFRLQLSPMMMQSCAMGQKGRFKISGLEFEIVATTSSTSTIRFRYERQVYEVADGDLRTAADTIQQFMTDEDRTKLQLTREPGQHPSSSQSQ
jgi:hypothetical protein